MNRFQRGLSGAMVGIVMGVVLTTIVASFVEDELLPSYFIIFFGVFSLVANIATINTLHSLGILYSAGWLLGAWLFIDILDVWGIIFNIAAPIIIIIVRAVIGIKKYLDR